MRAGARSGMIAVKRGELSRKARYVEREKSWGVTLVSEVTFSRDSKQKRVLPLQRGGMVEVETRPYGGR